MPTYQFETLTATAKRRVTCPVCGKARTVQRTLSQTVNPFHPAVKALGPGASEVACERAVQKSVDAAAAEWQPREARTVHDKCWPAWEASQRLAGVEGA